MNILDTKSPHLIRIHLVRSLEKIQKYSPSANGSDQEDVYIEGMMFILPNIMRTFTVKKIGP